jgi:hypothetical protein
MIVAAASSLDSARTWNGGDAKGDDDGRDDVAENPEFE